MSVPRILVLEDNAGLREIFVQALVRAGYQVHAAAGLAQARAALTGGRVDVLLCDIQLGEKRGTDLLRERIEDFRRNGTHVIVVSAEDRYRPACEELGVDFYLEKPVNVEMLLTLVERLVTHTQQQERDESMGGKKLQVTFEVSVQSGNGNWDVDGVLQEMERLGLTVVSHREGEGVLLTRKPHAVFAEVSTPRHVPFP